MARNKFCGHAGRHLPRRSRSLLRGRCAGRFNFVCSSRAVVCCPGLPSDTRLRGRQPPPTTRPVLLLLTAFLTGHLCCSSTKNGLSLQWRALLGGPDASARHVVLANTQMALLRTSSTLTPLPVWPSAQPSLPSPLPIPGSFRDVDRPKG